MENTFQHITNFIRKTYNSDSFIPLHAPNFIGNEKKYLANCIDSTFVSYVGEYVTQFEKMICKLTGATYAIAMVNGTTALHISLKLIGVSENDEVLTQALTFVATSNAIAYCNAHPVYIDCDTTHLGMSPEKLEEFLSKETILKDDGYCYNKSTKRKITGCVPVHIFGHPAQIDKIVDICNRYHITVVEDSAESIGSYYNEKHTGIFGKLGILSFNGNKTITTGGGGMIITHDKTLAEQAKYITTTAKVPHPYEFVHDQLGYNFRMPNVNAAIGCAQMESLDTILKNKRELANLYSVFFNTLQIPFFTEKENCHTNYWLNLIFLNDRQQRDDFIKFTNDNKVMTRPVWTLMTKLKMYKQCQSGNLDNSLWLEDRLVNLPSSFRNFNIN